MNWQCRNSPASTSPVPKSGPGRLSLKKGPGAFSQRRNAPPNSNVALASNGTTVSGSFDRPELLIDGHTQYDDKSGVAAAKWPGVAILTLKQEYTLQEIRFKIYDRDPRIAHYVVSTSTDGKNFTVTMDCSKI